MKKVGWVESYAGENPDSGFNFVWTEAGADVLDSIWSMMEILGGPSGRGCDQSTWEALSYFAIFRHRDPSPSSRFGK